MANKIKKISINAFEKAVETDYEQTVNVEWRGLTIVVKHSLALNDMLTFVDSVVKSCFEKETGTYMPEVKDFATRSCIIEHYTNITLPSSIEKRYDLLYHSDLLDAIMPNIEQLQFNALIRAIEDKTAHLAQANIEAVSQQMNDLYASMDNMRKQFEATFTGVDGNELNKVIAALSGGQLDEAKIVNAIMDAKKRESGE